MTTQFELSTVSLTSHISSQYYHMYYAQYGIWHAGNWMTEELVDLLRNCPDWEIPESFIAVAYVDSLTGISDRRKEDSDAHDSIDNVRLCLLLPGDEDAY